MSPVPRKALNHEMEDQKLGEKGKAGENLTIFKHLPHQPRHRARDTRNGEQVGGQTGNRIPLNKAPKEFAESEVASERGLRYPSRRCQMAFPLNELCP